METKDHRLTAADVEVGQTWLRATAERSLQKEYRVRSMDPRTGRARMEQTEDGSTLIVSVGALLAYWLPVAELA